ncbi:MAG TPA: DUF2071 domain-containing protein [Acidimicrobiales bacterium]|nr:DUF2071 domain-containing protein [Acidimicrobiales bacterium]
MTHGPAAPHHVRVPVMRHRWETLTFLHWPFDVNTVQRLLPSGLAVEPWEGRAWVALVPFHMRVRPPIGPALPGVTTFPETNVRTYVTGPDGRPGVWFFSLDAANAPAVVAARTLYGLPYFLARMKVERDGDTVTYRSHRIGPLRPRASHHIVVETGSPLSEEQLGPFEHYLTARFTLWARHVGAILSSPAEHPPWTLREARAVQLEQDLLRAAGLPDPSGEPLAHFAEGVDVRIGRPRIIQRRSERRRATGIS